MAVQNIRGLQKGPYLWFAEAAVETTTEAICIPASAYLGANPTGDNAMTLNFMDTLGTDAVKVVTLTIKTDTHKEVMAALAAIMNSSPHKNNGGVIVVADAETTTAKELLDGSGASYSPAKYGKKTPLYHKEFKGNVTACAIA